MKGIFLRDRLIPGRTLHVQFLDGKRGLCFTMIDDYALRQGFWRRLRIAVNLLLGRESFFSQVTIKKEILDLAEYLDEAAWETRRSL